MIRVRLKGAVELVLPTVSCSPDGTDWKLSETVCGSSWRLLTSCAPPESVAVSWISRYEGYSWSGALNEPLATPVNVCTICVWQFDGQWCKMIDQDSAEAGSVPSSG